MGSCAAVCPDVSLQSAGVTDAGDEIRRVRLARGLSQKEVAEGARVDVKTVGRIERGESQDPRKLGAIQNFLKLGEYAGTEDRGPALRDASNAELLAEMARRFERGTEPRPPNAADTERYDWRAEDAPSTRRRSDQGHSPRAGDNTG